MPWVDIIIIVVIALSGFVGYSIGLFGALAGFISKIVALIAAWIVTPIAQAWLETRWGIESIFVRLINGRIPPLFKDMITDAAKTAQTAQAFREQLYSSMPPQLAVYLQRTIEKSGGSEVPAPDVLIDVISREVAQSLTWALLFLLIWMVLSILLKGFLSMIFVSSDEDSILGIMDGILGMTAMVVITVTVMIIISGLLYPLALMSGVSGSFAPLYPHMMGSRLTNWLASIYQMHLLPLIDRWGAR